MPKARSPLKPSGLPIIHPFAAGIDIGSRFHVAAVSPDLCNQPVQTFQAFTSDLERMADWLVATGTKTVVMESTGVYSVAAYEVNWTPFSAQINCVCRSVHAHTICK